MRKRKLRSEVPVEQTWNLEVLFASHDAWKAEAAALETETTAVTQYRGRLSEGAAVLLACIEAMERFRVRLARVIQYASRRYSEDGTSAQNQAAYGQAVGLLAKVDAAFTFIRAEILALPGGAIEAYMQEVPELQSCRPYLQNLLDDKPYQLSEQSEAVLAALREAHSAPMTIYGRAKSSDMQFQPIRDADDHLLDMSFTQYESQHEFSSDVDLRRRAFASFTQGLKPYMNTFAATLATEINKNVVLARLRGYESATDMFLRSYHAPEATYHHILDVIQQELAPHMQRYARLRQRVLGLDTLLHCDLKTPLDPTYAPTITFAEARDLIVEGLSILGPACRELLLTAFNERCIDWADNVGKASGAFCAPCYGHNPVVLLTWSNLMRSVFLLTHELGHFMHFALSARAQRVVNFSPPLFFVEAPSTATELLLGQHILDKSADTRMRRWVLEQFLGTYYHNFVTHLLEAELLRRLYARAEEGQAITATTLNEEKGAILQRFWGDTVQIDEGAKLTWMRQPHYYLGLYPFTYAAGLTVGTGVAQAIREQGQPAIDRWLQALRAGGALRPLDLMQLVGVDMTSPAPIRKAVAYVGSIIDELEQSYAASAFIEGDARLT